MSADTSTTLNAGAALAREVAAVSWCEGAHVDPNRFGFLRESVLVAREKIGFPTHPK